jgi:2-polyprenyl-3-methyl-5-hydroxy-6-metoxy-1,4-benzoquinol methylase
MLNSGERQVAPTIEGIRHDHVARYAWAAQVMLPPHSRVIDIACGVGYGTRILAECGHLAFGADADVESIQYAKANYAHARAAFGVVDAGKVTEFRGFDAAVCFETIEHIRDPSPLLRGLAACKVLLASVPNEDDFPFAGHKFHFRHYRPAEFEALLNACGWNVQSWFRQEGPFSDVSEGKRGRTTIAVCTR